MYVNVINQLLRLCSVILYEGTISRTGFSSSRKLLQSTYISNIYKQYANQIFYFIFVLFSLLSPVCTVHTAPPHHRGDGREYDNKHDHHRHFPSASRRPSSSTQHYTQHCTTPSHFIPSYYNTTFKYVLHKSI